MPLIHRKVRNLLNGYVQSPKVVQGIDRYIVPPALGNRAGVLGAIALAMDCLGSHPQDGLRETVEDRALNTGKSPI
jgi:hypothetical protein